MPCWLDTGVFSSDAAPAATEENNTPFLSLALASARNAKDCGLVGYHTVYLAGLAPEALAPWVLETDRNVSLRSRGGRYSSPCFDAHRGGGMGVIPVVRRLAASSASRAISILACEATQSRRGDPEVPRVLSLLPDLAIAK